MKKLEVKLAEPQDSATVLRWLESTPQNLADPRVLFMPLTRVLKVQDETGPLLYLPVQITATLDGIAKRPGLTPLQMAKAMRELIPTVMAQAQASGIQEINFFIADDQMADFAAHNGFEEVKHRLFRLRIPTRENG